MCWATVLACCCPLVWSNGFLVQQLNEDVDAASFQSDLMEAMGEALGCGGQVSPTQLDQIRKSLTPTWVSLQKNQHGRVDRSSFRYLARRYFMGSGLHIRGFEASRPVNSSHWGPADILSQKVPGYVESVLDSQDVQERGFSLEDGVTLIATLTQLIFDSESTTLEKVYRKQHKLLTSVLSKIGLNMVLKEYMLFWLMGGDEELVAEVLNDEAQLTEVLPRWPDIQFFVEGQIKLFDNHRDHAGSRMLKASRYTFQDAHEIVGEITRSFALFWESECDMMKMELVAMDKRGTGRVPLSSFYGAALDSQWRFGESEGYLLELGAIDDTSMWYGKQVIIPNYMQGTSNCIVSTRHYHVCCLNICDGILSEIEEALKSPTALPSDILELVEEMNAPSSIEDEGRPNLRPEMRKQLEEVAVQNGGMVPLHGRLFAQWLHFVFPRECAFPHMTGLTSALSPYEYGDETIATQDEMERHVTHGRVSTHLPDNETADWLSQWTFEEELITEVRSLRSSTPDIYLIVGGLLVLVAVGMGAGIVSFAPKSSPTRRPGETRSHFV